MIRLRPATDADAPGVIALIDRVYGEWEGVVLDLEGVDRDLRAPASSLDRFWVYDREGEIVGTGACSLHAEFVELKKMYVDAAYRGRGLGRRMVELIERTGRERGLARAELWSDTRFLGAHAMYEHLGYRKSGRTRELHDPSNTVEYHLTKPL